MRLSRLLNNKIKKFLLDIYFLILDNIIIKNDSYYAFTVGCVGKNKFYDNSRALFEYIKKDNDKKKVILIYDEDVDLKLDQTVNTLVVKLFTIKGLLLLAKCKNIILFHSFAFDYSKKLGDYVLPLNFAKHSVINLWHNIKLFSSLDLFDIISVGSDWQGTIKCNRLEEEFKKLGVEVVYFPYTKITSSTKINEILNMILSEIK